MKLALIVPARRTFEELIIGRIGGLDLSLTVDHVLSKTGYTSNRYCSLCNTEGSVFRVGTAAPPCSDGKAWFGSETLLLDAAHSQYRLGR